MRIGEFPYILTVEQIPLTVAHFLLEASAGNKYLMLLYVNILLLLVGMFMEGLAAVLISHSHPRRLRSRRSGWIRLISA